MQLNIQNKIRLILILRWLKHLETFSRTDPVKLNSDLTVNVNRRPSRIESDTVALIKRPWMEREITRRERERERDGGKKQ